MARGEGGVELEAIALGQVKRGIGADAPGLCTGCRMNLTGQATAADYLSRIAPDVQARAIAYTHGGHWLILWSWLATLVVCWLIVRSGVLGRLRDHIAPDGAHRNLAVFLCAGLFGLVRWALSLPWSSYQDWWREKAYGMASQSYVDWLTQGGIQAVISALFSAVFFVGLYALIRTTRRWWPLWAAGLAGGLSILALLVAPVLLQPIFNHYTPAPEGPARQTIERLTASAGVRNARIFIYDGSRQSNRFTANVSGLGSTAQVAVSDVLVRSASPAELRAVVAHEIGHYRHGHLVILATFLTFLFGLGFWLIDRLFPLAARLMGQAGGSLSDPANLPIVIALVTTLTVLATPLIYSVQRAVEMDADNFSLAQTADPDALSTALLKSADYRAPSPTALEEILFYDHPSIAHRLRNAMAWKARHPDG